MRAARPAPPPRGVHSRHLHLDLAPRAPRHVQAAQACWPWWCCCGPRGHRVTAAAAAAQWAPSWTRQQRTCSSSTGRPSLCTAARRSEYKTDRSATTRGSREAGDVTAGGCSCWRHGVHVVVGDTPVGCCLVWRMGRSQARPLFDWLAVLAFERPLFPVLEVAFRLPLACMATRNNDNNENKNALPIFAPSVCNEIFNGTRWIPSYGCVLRLFGWAAKICTQKQRRADAYADGSAAQA